MPDAGDGAPPPAEPHQADRTRAAPDHLFGFFGRYRLRAPPSRSTDVPCRHRHGPLPRQGAALPHNRPQTAVAILKLHRNKRLTATDLAELERMRAEAGVGTPGRRRIERIRGEGGLGLFVRSLVEFSTSAAAKRAFEAFIQGRKLTSARIPRHDDRPFDGARRRGPAATVQSPPHRYQSARRR